VRPPSQEGSGATGSPPVPPGERVERSFDPGLETGYLPRAPREGPPPVELGSRPFDPGPGIGVDPRRAKRQRRRRERQERERRGADQRRRREAEREQARERAERLEVERRVAEREASERAERERLERAERQRRAAGRARAERAERELRELELRAEREAERARRAAAEAERLEAGRRGHDAAAARAELEAARRQEIERLQLEAAERRAEEELEHRRMRARELAEKRRRAKAKAEAKAKPRVRARARAEPKAGAKAKPATTAAARAPGLTRPSLKLAAVATAIGLGAMLLGSVAGLPTPLGSGHRGLVASLGLAGGPADPGTAAALYRGPFHPVLGKYDYGEKAARFGAPRSGHAHEGQDIFSKSGTPLVAVRDGVVVDGESANGRYSGGRGNYVVIFSPVENRSYVFLHMLKPSTARIGDRVHAGQIIGRMGCTGSCDGTHLHFEVRIGKATLRSDTKPIDPLPFLENLPQAPERLTKP
jgi:murein DD-endopeptidase MepM/ murein hydrolase activator NlpD